MTERADLAAEVAALQADVSVRGFSAPTQRSGRTRRVNAFVVANERHEHVRRTG